MGWDGRVWYGMVQGAGQGRAGVERRCVGLGRGLGSRRRWVEFKGQSRIRRWWVGFKRQGRAGVERRWWVELGRGLGIGSREAEDQV